MLLCCCLFFAGGVYAQANYTLVLQSTSAHPIPINIPSTVSFASSQKRNTAMQQLQFSFWQQGYAAFSIDSIVQVNDSVIKALVFVGEKYVWQKCLVPSAIKNFSLSNDSIVNWSLLKNDFINFCNTLANNGYPFAAIQLKNVAFINQYVSAEVAIDSGKKYLIDTVEINGKIKLQGNFIYRHLGIWPKQMYNQQAISGIDSLLQKLPYLTLTKPTNILLQNTGAKVVLHVANKPSNEVDALVGFLPQNASVGGRLQVVGEARVQLNNALGAGERIGINWQQLQPQSPRLLLHYQQPFFLKSAIGIATNFQLYKKDSAFITLLFSVAASKQITANKQLRLQINTYRSNALVIDTIAVKNTLKLPDVNDVSISSLGIAYVYTNISNIAMPTKGLELVTDINFGNKRVLKNNTITQLKNTFFNYASLYDSVTLNSYQIKAQLTINQYYSVATNQVLKLAIKAGLLQSENYFRNELFQIGGYKQLRGFNEESIFCNRYAIPSVEYRLLLTSQSFLFTFFDAAIASQIQNNRFQTSKFFGTGFGIALNTKSGILNVAYAVGKMDKTPVNLRESKLHINFTTVL